MGVIQYLFRMPRIGAIHDLAQPILDAITQHQAFNGMVNFNPDSQCHLLTNTDELRRLTLAVVESNLLHGRFTGA